MKKFLSAIMSVILAITATVPISNITTITASASDYATTLKNKGFPESYIDSLVELHEKYPNWIFEPLITNLDWSTAVSGERSTHSNQLIEKTSSTSTSMYCNCSKCYKNGSYVIQESSNWVSASETAVEYYMDPRNWLSEKYIFQFESTEYDGTQTKAGVESILKGTWMYNSLITYKTTSGSSKTYNSTTKYSDAIMTAANDSGLSAYYIASKIKQENGGSSASATAVKGTASPFQGIYNYYNIGAYTGAYDGLEWAAGYIRTTKSTTLYSKYNSSKGTVSGTKTTLKSGQYMTWRANCGDYYYVRLYDTDDFSEGASGYVLKSACRQTYLGNTSTGWGRPWTNPYKSIYYGAKYIASNFGDQTTGYLQKFNVSPTATTLYTHEYMANVAAPAAESLTTYNAYKNADILDLTKTFYIPVYKNMPDDSSSDANTSPSKMTLKASSTASTITLKWSKQSGVTGYVIYKYDSSTKKYKLYKNIKSASTTSYKISNLSSNKTYKFKIYAYTTVGSKTYKGELSSAVSITTLPKKMSLSASSTNTTVTLKWSKQSGVTGYIIYKYDSSANEYKKYKTIKDASTTSYKISKLSCNKTYKFKIRAYKTVGSKTYNGEKSSAKSITTKNHQVSISSAKSSKTKRITVKWSKLSGVSGYEIRWSTTSDFSSNFLSVYEKGSSATSTTLKTAQSGRKYYVKVRAYKTVNGKKKYYQWSKTLTVKVK